ncbi:MAG TPA: DUF4256 domain-containing protein [Bacteroidia bacterium]|nr:DUF4256 domain-containing protein [Bacteroidia bacterium]
MAKEIKKDLPTSQQDDLLNLLKARFDKNMKRHKDLQWSNVQLELKKAGSKMWSLSEMEKSGGEPDVIGFDKKSSEYIFCDCSPESPSGRRSLCYDREALDARKEHKPKSSAIEMADAMGIKLLTEEEYRQLQQLGKFDTKTSSWLLTPPDIRKLDGAIFGDFRYNTVFVYHNGVQSYYAARGFRGLLRV